MIQQNKGADSVTLGDTDSDLDYDCAQHHVLGRETYAYLCEDAVHLFREHEVAMMFAV